MALMTVVGPTLGRVLGYMLQNYKFSCFMVVVCVIGSALASVLGVGGGRLRAGRRAAACG